ncbi:MAG: hypothetical protein H3C47_02765 [Candidatus Cloacimonetes bacterium]|nr:hypothetical protein [Candidatus Cloacimonadota bacterium]
MWTTDPQSPGFYSWLESSQSLNRLRDTSQSDSHALCLSSEEDVNLFLYTGWLLRRLFCDSMQLDLRQGIAQDKGPCGQCQGCLSLSQMRPDRFLCMFPCGQDILVGQIRELIRSLSQSRLRENTSQIALMFYPDKMRVEGANAILKTLEEPPQGRRFLMVLPNSRPLLPTIRSRVSMFALPSARALFQNTKDTKRIMGRLSGYACDLLESELLMVPKPLEMYYQELTQSLQGLHRDLSLRGEDESPLFYANRLVALLLWNPARSGADKLTRRLGALDLLQVLMDFGAASFLDRIARIKEEWAQIGSLVEGICKDLSLWNREKFQGLMFHPILRDFRDYKDKEAFERPIHNLLRGYVIRETEGLIGNLFRCFFDPIFMGQEPMMAIENQLLSRYGWLEQAKMLWALQSQLAEVQQMVYNNFPLELGLETWLAWMRREDERNRNT